MAKKTPKQLDDEIDRYLRGEVIGPRQLAPMPRWDAKKAKWTGGDKRTLYAFERDGRIVVLPGGSGGFPGVGHNSDGRTTVRIATVGEAEEHWQKPVHSGWNVRG